MRRQESTQLDGKSAGRNEAGMRSEEQPSSPAEIQPSEESSALRAPGSGGPWWRRCCAPDASKRYATPSRYMPVNLFIW